MPQLRSFPVSTPSAVAACRALWVLEENYDVQSVGHWWSVPWMNFPVTSFLYVYWMASNRGHATDLAREQPSVPTVPHLELWPEVMAETRLTTGTKDLQDHNLREHRPRATWSGSVLCLSVSLTNATVVLPQATSSCSITLSICGLSTICLYPTWSWSRLWS